MQAWARVRVIAGCVFLAGVHASGQNFVITTVAGGGVLPTPAQATTSTIGRPGGIAIAQSGNLYFIAGNAVYRVDRNGTMIRVAGRPGLPGYSGDGGQATKAQLFAPGYLALAANGKLYISDSGNNCVRAVDPDGTISTVAGNGMQGDSGDGGSAINAQLYSPQGLAFDSAGSLYIAEAGGSRIRKVTQNGIISAVAGNGGWGYSGDGGPALAAQLGVPQDLALDAAGNLYIGDRNNSRVRKVTPAGSISTVAGNGTSGFSGDGGPATTAQLSHPSGLAVDAAANLLIADTGNSRIRKVTPAGVISTIAGDGTSGFSGDGGPAISAQFYAPAGIAISAAGNLYVADPYSNRVRVISTAGIISTVAGNGESARTGDGGQAADAQFSAPYGLATDVAGNLYIADLANSRVRKITPVGLVSTVAGTGVSGYSGDGGAAASAELMQPAALAVDAAGNLYIADGGDCRVRKVSPSGIISTVAGNGTAGFSGDGGPATSAQLWGPNGLAVDAAGNLYISDLANSRVRKVTAAGIISTLAGNGTDGSAGDGGLATNAQLSATAGLAVDAAGNLYIADVNGHRIRKVTPTGSISTFAGNGAYGNGGDGGPATLAQISSPEAIGFDPAGNLYIGDQGRNLVRMVNPAGVISTVAGGDSRQPPHNAPPDGDGGPAMSALLGSIMGLAPDAAGNIYVADSANSVLRLLIPQGVRPVLALELTHPAKSFLQGDIAQTYSVVVSNARAAGPTTRAVTVTGIVPPGLSLMSMTGPGWTCSNSSCSRSDALAQGAS